MGRQRKKDEDGASENDVTIKELKSANRRLKSDNQRLKMEIATLHEAFNKTSTYLQGNTDNISVEKIIEGVKKDSTLAQIKKTVKCDKCNSFDVKDFYVTNVGRIILCANCKSRKVVKNEKEEN